MLGRFIVVAIKSVPGGLLVIKWAESIRLRLNQYVALGIAALHRIAHLG